MSKRKVSEHVHQVTLVSWFDRTYPQYSGRLFAVPNGGLRNKLVAMKLKTEGVRRGVPDLFLPVPSNGYHGLFIELKTENGRASAEQKEWLTFLDTMGYKAILCHGFEHASKEITCYLSTTT